MVQLHLHTSASLLDGVGNIKRYVQKAIENGMPGIALTDHGNMSLTYDFYNECKKNNINPILGEEFYIALSEDEIKEELERLKKIDEEIANDFISEEYEDDEEQDIEKEQKNSKKKSLISLERQSYHQIVLVKSLEGWKNACKLNYYSFLKSSDKSFDRSKGGFYYKPRITRDFLFEAKNGLIVTSTCLASQINRHITNNKIDEAYRLVELYKENFKDDFYIELQINELDTDDISQRKNNEVLIQISKDLNIKPIITGDVHYNEKVDAELQDAIIAINRGTTIYDEKGFKIHTRNLYFHTREDYYRMNKEFGYNYSNSFIDECLDNTLEINEKCNFNFEKKKNYPKFYDTEEESKKALIKYCTELLKQFINNNKLSKEDSIVYIDRLKYELDVINKNGYTDYFLVVKDIIDFCKKEGIIIGAGRGSAGNSLVSFLLGITKINPIEYDLFFERFINPEALSDPDIDIDFESERRDEVIEYLKSKWGEDSVIRIANYVTYNVKSALKDFSRALKRSYDDVEFICSDKNGQGNIPPNLTPENIDEWFEKFSEQKDAKEKRIYQWYIDNKDIVEWFKKIYGNIKTVSQHAGGVLITPNPVYCYIPVNRSKNVLVTGYAEASSHKNLLSLGLLKIDLLGLESLTIMKKTIEMIKQVRGIDVSKEVYDIDLNNEELYKEFSKGNNFLIFQFESQGISDIVRKSVPKNIYDVTAINSLWRPGAMQSGATYEFAEICGGNKDREYIHPLVDKVLDKTRGVIAYQEQISRIIFECTNKEISIGKAELYRKAIMDLTDKYKDVVEEFKKVFVPLCVKNNIKKEKAEQIQEYLLSNAGYLFNNCHSAVYSYIAMQTLYLKLYYTAEFYAVNLSMEKDKTMFPQYIADATLKGIIVKQPNIIDSEYNFKAINEKEIVCGLDLLKGFGEKAYNEFIEVRKSTKFDNVVDFIVCPLWKKMNKKCFEILAKAGCFKPLEENTKIVIELLSYHNENKKNFGKVDKKTKQEKYSKQHLLDYYTMLKEKNMKDYSESEYNELWKSATGFSNPFNNRMSKYLETFSKANVVGVSAWKQETPYVYGEIVDKKELFTKNDKPYVNIKISDGFLEKSVIIWNNNLETNAVMKAGGLDVGNIICIELDKDNFGFKYKYKGKFFVLER